MSGLTQSVCCVCKNLAVHMQAYVFAAKLRELLVHECSLPWPSAAHLHAEMKETTRCPAHVQRAYFALAFTLSFPAQRGPGFSRIWLANGC